ncbi:glycine--tRNA ligase subunit beta [Sphingobium vermicomposti]|uniref:Glycine--tRNA ligase beta subunit n=1 Tax=Sphingobium vermicomposti TaxID=529005 RepID=A0A846M4C8_9SPHN|nr:glycine--tRNA ligase subunit beta [Sphingobium vermicomposti]NIJ16393.1 glycyl-tRNA synthetase beta chain [Sphingobium vermicomposti]
MTDFLLELRCEEIPARMQLKASEDLARLFTEELAKAGLKPESIDSFVTPRRLALIARSLPLETAAVSEEFKGPRTSAPAQALEGFLRKTGLTQDQLEDRDGVWFATVNKPGRATAGVLAETVPAIIRAFPWPKSMRWGTASQTTESLRWVRPLQGIVAILGEDLVDIEIEGTRSGYATLGHRFHHPGEITIGGAHDYVEKLRACHVIVSHQERQAIIEAKAQEVAAAKGYTVIEDKGLIAENAGLTEWPVPLLGDFDPAFLEVPPEVIQLTLRINQKYFVLRDGEGKLAPAFICTANIEAKDGGEAIIAGNRKVLAARLSDARFFWEQDRKTSLADHAKKLERITFHEKLWTVKRKVERVAIIAADRIPELIGWPEEKARKMQPFLRQAAELAKADLVTEMVGEFPELQGVMGSYYADAEGLSVSIAIRDHYKPIGQSDDLPSDDLGTVVSLADKVDTLYSFFLIDQKPTGSKDPFALRRAALGLIRLIVDNGLRVSLNALYRACDWERLYQSDGLNYADPTDDLVAFTIDRLKVQQKEAGVRHDLIDAVFALGGEDDLVCLLARVKALQSFIATDDGTNLLAGYKRAANILKKEGVESPSAPAKAGAQGDEALPKAGLLPPQEHGALSYTPEPAEADLIAALDAAEPRAMAAVMAEDFEGAMAALATLRAPIDTFFDNVTVNDADPAKRSARLALLVRVREAVHAVADFSKIAG